MIYFFNGAAKHGSFFQYFIVQKALNQIATPYSQVKNTFFHRHYVRSARRQLKELSSSGDGLFLIKGHWGDPRERRLLLSCHDIKIFLIWRDFRDVLVSQFFFELNKFGRQFVDFDDYYWRYLGGRYHLRQQLAYKRGWDSVASPGNVCAVSFEDLKNDFVPTAGALLRFAGIDGVDLARLEQDVTVEKLRKDSGDNGAHFRKGAIGDHRSVITSPHTIDDIDALVRGSAEGVLRPVSAAVNTLRRCPGKSALVRNLAYGVARQPVVWARAWR